MKFSLETPNSLEAVLMLAENFRLCICIPLWVWLRYSSGLCDRYTIVKGDQLHITAGWEAQDCRTLSVHYMEGTGLNRAPVAQLVEHRAVTREVVSLTPAGPTLRVFK